MILHRVTGTENYLLKQGLKPKKRRKTSIYDLIIGLKLVLKYDF